MAQLKDLIVNGNSRFISDINFNKDILPGSSGTQNIGSSTQTIGTIYATTFDGWATTAGYSVTASRATTAGYAVTADSATTAISLNTSAGNSTVPIYFDNSGKPAQVTALNLYVIAGNKSGETIGSYATVEGINNIAGTTANHAEGYYTSATGGTGAHAEGYYTFASGNGAHAEGRGANSSTPNKADGAGAHAEGIYTYASGSGAHAEGYSTTATGSGAHAEGYYTIASITGQHVVGRYNISNTNYAEIVGIGTTATNRLNGRTLDWSGNETLAGGIVVKATTAGGKTVRVSANHTTTNTEFLSFGKNDIQSYNNTNATALYINKDGGNINIGPGIGTANGDVTIGASVYNKTTSSDVIIGPHAAKIQIGRTTQTTAQDIQIGKIHFGSGIIAQDSTHRLKSINSEDTLYLFSAPGGSVAIGSADSTTAIKIFYINASNNIVRPGSNNSIKLGGPTTAWSNVYSYENFIVNSNSNAGIIISKSTTNSGQHISIGYDTIQGYANSSNATAININPDGGDIYLGKGLKVTTTNDVDETDLTPVNSQSHNLGSSSGHWNTGYIDKIMTQSITCSNSIYAQNGTFTNSITAANKLVVDLTQVNVNGVALNGDTVTIPIKAPVSSIWHGICSTSANVTSKEVILTDNTINPSAPSIGQMLIVRFSTTNSAASPTMMVTNGNGNTLNSTPLYRYGSTAMSTGVTSTGWSAGAVVPFIYSGTSWTRLFWENTNTNTTSPTVNSFGSGSTTRYYLVASSGTANQAANKQLYKSYNAGATNGTGIYFTSGDMILMGAGWNDYAEFRRPKEEDIKPGRVVKENGDGTLSLATKRLERGCEIVTDTYGFGIGKTDTATLPTAATGRVLAYPDADPQTFEPGAPVCSGPGGTVSMMTEEEERLYPSRIIGTVSEIPDYDIWYGPRDVIVDGRIWIRIR